MIVSLPASPWFYRSLNAALLLLLAWFAAGLFWQVLAPAPLPPVAAPGVVAQRLVSMDVSALNVLFGQQAAGPVSMSSLGLKLRGVIGSSAPAAAIFERPGAPAQAVKTGEEVEPGVRLQEVAADHAILDNRGRRERIDLDAKPAASGVTAYAPGSVADPRNTGKGGSASSAALYSRAPMVGRPPALDGRGGDARTLNRQTLASGMQSLNVNDWTRGLADAPREGGVLVENAAAQPLAGPLGLQSGDILTQVNGTDLRKAGDIASLYAAFSRADSVQVELLRNGSPLSLRFRIESQPAL